MAVALGKFGGGGKSQAPGLTVPPSGGPDGKLPLPPFPTLPCFAFALCTADSDWGGCSGAAASASEGEGGLTWLALRSRYDSPMCSLTSQNRRIEKGHGGETHTHTHMLKHAPCRCRCRRLLLQLHPCKVTGEWRRHTHIGPPPPPTWRLALPCLWVWQHPTRSSLEFSAMAPCLRLLPLLISKGGKRMTTLRGKATAAASAGLRDCFAGPTCLGPAQPGYVPGKRANRCRVIGVAMRPGAGLPGL